MSLHFNNTDVSALYSELCRESAKNLENTKREITQHFSEISKKKELAEYKEKIFTAKLRSEQIDSSIMNVSSSVFIPAVISTIIAIATLIVQNIFKKVDPTTIPVYIASFVTIGYVISIVWKRRQNSKSEQEWIAQNRILYFLEHYEIEE